MVIAQPATEKANFDKYNKNIDNDSCKTFNRKTCFP